jgi:hypothetical protein
MSTWQYIVFSYLAFAFVKFMICAYHLPASICALSRLHGAKRGRVKLSLVFVMPVTLACTAVLSLPFTMFKEGFKFFSFYSRFTVMRACVTAYRENHKD